MSIPIRPNPIGPMALLTRVTVMVERGGMKKEVRKAGIEGDGLLFLETCLYTNEAKEEEYKVVRRTREIQTVVPSDNQSRHHSLGGGVNP